MISSLMSIVPSIVNLASSEARARQQEKRAKELIMESKKITKSPIRKEFEQARRGADMMATQGLASTFTAQKQLDADAANNLKAIQQSSPSGAVASAAIASTIADKNKASQSLLARDAEFRTAGAKSALDTLWNVGEKERELEIEQREIKEGLQRRAMALEDSALKRKEMAGGQFLKSTVSPLTMLGGSLDKLIGGTGMSATMPSEGGGGSAIDLGITSQESQDDLLPSDTEMDLGDEELTLEQFELLSPEEKQAYLTKIRKLKK